MTAVIENYISRYLTSPDEVTDEEIEEWAKAGITYRDVRLASEADGLRHPGLHMARASIRCVLLAKDPEFIARADLQMRRKKTLRRFLDGIVWDWDNPYIDPGGWTPLEDEE